MRRGVTMGSQPMIEKHLSSELSIAKESDMKLFYGRHSLQFIMCGSLAVLTAFFVSILYWIYSSETVPQVVINEVCSSNFSLIQDDNGSYSDYIELYNTSSQVVWLDGFFLSDNENQLEKYPLSAIEIPPEGFHVVWLDGSDDILAGRTGFKISSQGEQLYLSNADTGEIIDCVTVPKLSYNTSYGRVADGGEEWKIMTATAGSSNGEAEKLPFVALSDPVFSAESGFYEESFELAITAKEDAVIYYTLDGSDPTSESIRYQEPIKIEDASSRENVLAARTDLSPTRNYVPSFQVDKATVVRAISINEQEETVSEIVSKVYFVGYDQKKEYEDFPIISIVTDPDNLFDPVYGIYGNGVALEHYKENGGMQDGELQDVFMDEEGEKHFLYMASNAYNDGKEWERDASITYFDDRHNYCFTQNVGIQIAGQSTRATPKKSFSIYGREIYDRRVVLPYEFFPETFYSSIKLRNGGNNNSRLIIQDAFLESLVEGRNVSIQRSSPCVVFLDGEFWGIYNIRERYKEEYLRNHYGVNESNVWLIDAGNVRVGDDAAWEAYRNMVDTITECDLSYDDVYAMVCEWIDVQSLIDYCCINLYIDNRDVSFIQNTALWRTMEPEEAAYGDCRWRWMLFDLDDTLSNDFEAPEIAMKDNDLLNEPMIQSLLDNEQFRKQFCLTFMDLANTNYSYDTVHKKLAEWKLIYQDQLVKSRRRFFDGEYTKEESDADIAEMDDFFRQRFSYAAKGLAEAFGLTGSLETVTVSINLPEGGSVMVNTALLNEEKEWSGQYFTDYPISLTAIARDGYRFAGWKGDASGQEDQVEIAISEGGLQIEAIFEKVDE